MIARPFGFRAAHDDASSAREVESKRRSVPIQIAESPGCVSVKFEGKTEVIQMKLADIKQGDVVVTDAGFTCMRHGRHTVERDARGLFIRCDDGQHYLDGQEDHEGADLVGLSKPDA